jgi:hypothetical protein
MLSDRQALAKVVAKLLSNAIVPSSSKWPMTASASRPPP